MEFETRLKSYQGLVSERLSFLIPQESELPEVLHAAMRYACLAPGKRIRPALCLASCRLFRHDELGALDAACALELVHTFSLIHDDLPAIDDDDLRRGKPTVHKVYGEALAILTGDALFALAFQVLGGLEPTEVAARCSLELARSSGTSGLVGGEVMDVLAEGKQAKQDYVTEMHRRKTAALMACSASIGAIIGGASDEEVAQLRAFGEGLGMAFQISDDVLNLIASESVLGKAVGSDEGRGKSTYPSAIGLDASRSAATETALKASQALSKLHQDTSFLKELAIFACTRSN